MLSTGAMVRLGKVHGNLMVDLRATNTKLRDRARRIVCRLTGASEDEALRGLEAADWDVKTAVVMGQRGVSVREARKLLAAAGGRLRAALGEATAGPGGDPDSAPPGP
jgi:N-acetylmuramic acid 6-phosphate etherase